LRGAKNKVPGQFFRAKAKVEVEVEVKVEGEVGNYSIS
jgi:hypothetical protein